VFKFRCVYDSNLKHLTYLHGPKTTAEKKALSDDSNMGNYIGQFFNNAVRFAERQLNLKTLKPRPESKTNFDKILLFFSYKQSLELGLLINFCQRTIAYDNFESVLNQKAAIKPPTPKKTPVKDRLEAFSHRLWEHFWQYSLHLDPDSTKQFASEDKGIH